MSKKNEKRIVINIKDMDDIYNTFNPNDISEDLQYYLEDECGRAGKSDIIFEVVTEDELLPIDKSRLVTTIRKHYGMDVKNAEEMARRNTKVNLIYFIVGILFIIVLSYVQNIGFVLPEVLDIVGWVIIWESIYNLLFKDIEMDLEAVKAKKIYSSKIEFKNRRK